MKVVILACAVMLCVPVASWAQYTERWDMIGTLGPATSLIPGNVGNVDGDPQIELVVNEGGATGTKRVQVRNAITGAVEFTSSTSSFAEAFWTIYLVQLDTDSALEIVACDGRNVLVIDGGSVAAGPEGATGAGQDLRPAQPNPFLDRTALSYSLSAAGTAEVEIFDVAGRLVRRLGGARMPAGEHRLEWDGRDQSGTAMQPGMYLYRLRVDGRAVESQKTIRLGS